MDEESTWEFTPAAYAKQLAAMVVIINPGLQCQVLLRMGERRAYATGRPVAEGRTLPLPNLTEHGFDRPWRRSLLGDGRTQNVAFNDFLSNSDSESSYPLKERCDQSLRGRL